MDLSCTTGLLEKEARRRRIILNQSQKDTLRVWFEKNPNPDLATRGHLAKELGISESQIMTWFQKHRKIRKQVEYACCSEESQEQGQDRTQVKEARRSRTHFTKFQTDVLIEAFEKNRFPGIVTREKLAQQTGIPESRIHIWFQNRRARHPDPRQNAQATPHPPQSSQSPAQKPAGQLAPPQTLPSSCSVILPLSPPHTPNGPLDLSKGCQKQLPGTTLPQPSQVVQRRGDDQNPPLFIGHLSPAKTPGEESFHTQPPLRLLIQNRGRNPSENSGLTEPPLENSTEVADVNQHYRKRDQNDSTFLQHWDEWFQSMLAEWMPDKEYWSEKAELHPWHVQLQQLASVTHQADQIPQQ
ncbi:double homeobox protein B-like isoform X2 [Mastomys coucha]|nr:double homeobox protein B-like isoform X2 [Mastomys coucha]XP_031218258.1 double homeobox protein B-like isoform X2 [Mastomys coucha]XP_031218259.1 double homeobox protein B-like isoform X2 [Mastomys coucha]XP_031218260.1 double homeobox protein B-like isoform X2 [Mastomys coucha]XP_031218261.1 double homeobox protein B-like isoform X2 [Mastomys coucha]XP_031218262.1 double homeobox protein B-like isoform X2 [Mastomys coucha]XP_031218263.1 double homeobox protein B-like isoform X2 [Mastomy